MVGFKQYGQVMYPAASTSEIELPDYSPDLEAQASLPSRRTPWQRSPAQRSAITNSGSTSASNASNTTSILAWRWQAAIEPTRPPSTHLHQEGGFRQSDQWATSHWPNDHRLVEEHWTDFAKVSRAFAVAVAGKPLSSQSVRISSQYYIDLLVWKCRAAWREVIRPVLEGADRFSAEPSNHDLCKIFRIFLTIVLTIKDRDDIALVDLVDEVANNELLRYIDENRSHATQLVFSAFGWITMLYDPSLNPEKNSLQILCPPSSNPRVSKLSLIQRRSRHRSQTFSNLKQDLELSDQPFPSLLTVFGNILPEANVNGFGGHTGRLLHMSRSEDCIQPSNLCFYNLHKLLNITVHWVDCLSQHLEFDSHAKVLKLFRYPSLCLVMSYNEKSCLSRLFSDYAVSKGFAVHGKDDAGDYFKEIILSYCLMFGQQKSNLGRSITAENTWHPPRERDPDPLLDILCRPNWDGDDLANFLDEIDATIPMDDFSATKVFKFHGPRLLIIQRAMQGYQPDGIGPLWHDTRDAYKWWTLWAVLVIGVIAIVLGLIQILLQACQLYFTIRPR